MALLRAGHHLVTTESEDELLHSILNDAVSVLDAQRGAIVLADAPEAACDCGALASGEAKHRAVSISARSWPSAASAGASRSCAARSKTTRNSRGRSASPTARWLGALRLAAQHRASAWAFCISIEVTGKKRSRKTTCTWRMPWRLTFGRHRAMHCSARQRDLFLNTITILAQAVELRDEYTGGHTARVTNYSLVACAEAQPVAQDIDLIRIGTPLHDIGKIGIDDEILRKPAS